MCSISRQFARFVVGRGLGDMVVGQLYSVLSTKRCFTDFYVFFSTETYLVKYLQIYSGAESVGQCKLKVKLPR